jgi:hypothetical protein
MAKLSILVNAKLSCCIILVLIQVRVKGLRRTVIGVVFVLLL